MPTRQKPTELIDMRVISVSVDEKHRRYSVTLEGGLTYEGRQAIQEIRERINKDNKLELYLDVYSRRYLDQLKNQKTITRKRGPKQ